MGAKDIITKDYTEDCRVFADAFNQYIYKGEQVIKPENLKPLDSAVIGVPYGMDGATMPTQKFRDGIKYLTAMEDDEAVYLLMGIENQTDVHYAMPVRDMLYDALQYAGQVEKAARSYRKALGRAKEYGSDSEAPKNLKAGEYLSGFHKDDCLIPIITLVVYFSPGEWDGPRSLHEMMAVKDPNILSFVSDYKINLIAPANMTDEELDQFTSSLREVLLFIKYSKDKDRLNEILQTDERFRNVERKAAMVISTVTGMKFEVEDKEEENVDMCEALKGLMEDASKDGVQKGMQVMMRRMLKDGSVSVEYIAKMANMTVEEVRNLAAEQ